MPLEHDRRFINLARHSRCVPAGHPSDTATAELPAMSEKPTLTAELNELNQLIELNEPRPTSRTLCDDTTPSSPYTLADDLASAKA